MKTYKIKAEWKMTLVSELEAESEEKAIEAVKKEFAVWFPESDGDYINGQVMPNSLTVEVIE